MTSEATTPVGEWVEHDGGDCPSLAFDGDGHRTEALAWAWGLDCLLVRRDELRDGIKDARRELKAALRRERKNP